MDRICRKIVHRLPMLIIVMVAILFGKTGKIMLPVYYYPGSSEHGGIERVQQLLRFIPNPFAGGNATAKGIQFGPDDGTAGSRVTAGITPGMQDEIVAEQMREIAEESGGSSSEDATAQLGSSEENIAQSCSAEESATLLGLYVAAGSANIENYLPIVGRNNADIEPWTGGIINKTPEFLYDMSQFVNAEHLVSQFFTVDASTSVINAGITWDNMEAYDLHVAPGAEVPQILIYHTHSQEGYADSRPGNPEDTVVGAGEKLAELLRGYGYNVIHDTGEYDVIRRNDAYYYAADALEQILSENPSIEVVIDLHRDEMPEGRKLVKNINGKDCASFMFFNGLSYEAGSGPITYLANPNLQENLSFSLHAQILANEYYPGLTRKIYLRKSRYNMHYRGKSMLVELGAQTNTVEEAMNAVEPLAHVIAMTLGVQKE